MNKKASKWMIGALALAVLVPTAAFAATTPQSGAKMTAQVKTENGVPFYSTDHLDPTAEGVTDAPGFIILQQDGFENGSVGDKDSSVDVMIMDMMIKSEKGVPFYSIDKGKTWNKFLLPNPEVKTK
ncbi:hypothetical protein EEL31_12970 [Brevibacillus laterosporus]|nr:hypothetical protein [Brevibacillus laterosporus]TPG69342.1 hypothetical protein EEL31_12970 [Brevibacillus laterosporus]